MKKPNYISIEKEFPEERLSLPNVIGNKSIPSPFTKFGKSLDGILRNGGFKMDRVVFDYSGIDGELTRHYIHKSSGINVLYEHDVLLSPYKNFLLEILETMPEDSIDISNKDQVKFDPILFYDLYTKEKLSSEKIDISNKKSWLAIGNYKGTEFEREQLVYGEYKDLHQPIKKMFNIIGRIDFEDKHYFFPSKKTKDENSVKGENRIEEMYISQEAVLDYISNFVSNLSRQEGN